MTRYVLLAVVMIGFWTALWTVLGGIRSHCLRRRVDRDADEAMAILLRSQSIWDIDQSTPDADGKVTFRIRKGDTA